MKDLLTAIQLITKYDNMDFESCVSEFEKYTNQNIPLELIRKFKLTGLSNIDFLTSDFINQYGYKNLLQYDIK